jgi:membrane fusion protein, multidrug efflux system
LISGTPFSGQTNYTATIEALDSRTDKQTRNLMVRARLQDAPEFFRPGDSVTVSVEYGAQVEAVAVPAEAVRRTPEGTQVFIAVKDDQGNMRAKQRAVQIIQSMGERVAVHAGVKVGETVVVAGSFKLMDRNLLQIVENAQLTPNSSASANTGDAVDTQLLMEPNP